MGVKRPCRKTSDDCPHSWGSRLAPLLSNPEGLTYSLFPLVLHALEAVLANARLGAVGMRWGTPRFLHPWSASLSFKTLGEASMIQHKLRRANCKTRSVYYGLSLVRIRDGTPPQLRTLASSQPLLNCSYKLTARMNSKSKVVTRSSLSSFRIAKHGLYLLHSAN